MAPNNVRPLILMILDGFGVNPDPQWNAVATAKMPTYSRLLRHYPHTTLDASESHVGLPTGFMGNSEVGHLNIGAGRVVYQDFSLISRAIEDRSFFKNPVLLQLVEQVKANNGVIHLMGLVSDGGVHSHISHLFAALDLCKSQGLTKVWIHAITDGRDTSPTSGESFIRSLEDFCQSQTIGKIATVSGRFYTMDRDKRWDRTKSAFEAIALAKGEPFEIASKYVHMCYPNYTDEFLKPAVNGRYQGIQQGDGFWFFNFRADRARQITHALTDKEFHEFNRVKGPELSGFVCMTAYDATLKLASAFEKPIVPNTLGELVSKKGWKQLRIAETEKYAHVTYFFNGGMEIPFAGESRALIPSPREIKTYDLKPQMAAYEVTEKLMAKLEKGYTFVVVNFANPDMVGHTGIMPATVQALEVVDECLGRIIDWIETNDAMGILTADHGNCEKMMGEDGLPLTSHTLFPVPFVAIDTKRKVKLRSGGRLSDIAPSILALWGIDQPREMTGCSLVEIEK